MLERNHLALSSWMSKQMANCSLASYKDQEQSLLHHHNKIIISGDGQVYRAKIGWAQIAACSDS